MRVLYLHGFASSPVSIKAKFFGERLRAHGCDIAVPDLASGDFEHLTISGQLRVATNLIGTEPAIVIGSSLGGYLAALLAAGSDAVQKLILLAPAFDFYHLWMNTLGPERVANWRRTATLNVFHYGEGRDVPLNFGFLEDASRFDPFPDFSQPALLLHGGRDDVVPLELSKRYAASHGNVQLVTLSSGHELTDVLDPIWEYSKEFLFSNGPAIR